MTWSRTTWVWRAALGLLAVSWLAGISAATAADTYIRYDMGADRADPGYPKPIDSRTWPGVWTSGIDAAVNWGNGKAYFFKGSQYIRFDIAQDRTDPGYPKPIDAGTWPGLWTGGVDAAINWGNGKAYFFKGDQYIRYDIANDRADPGYPKPVNDNNWPGLAVLGPIQSAINWKNDKAYFFGRSGYVRYSVSADRADPGYPKQIDSGTWPGLTYRDIGAALTGIPGKAYFFKRTARGGGSVGGPQTVTPSCPAGFILSGTHCVRSATPAPSCPPGFSFSGGQCVRTAAPTPNCPPGFSFSGGQCVRTAVTTPAPQAPSEDLALQLQQELKRIGCLTGRVDGIWGSGSRAALARFANRARLRLGREPSLQAIDEARRTQAGFCKPVRVAPKRPKPKGCPSGTVFLEGQCIRRSEVQEFCGPGYTRRGSKCVSMADQPPKPPKVVKKKRCSAIKYAFTRGNTCACSDNRIFTGSACVKRKQDRPWQPGECRKVGGITVCS